MVKVKASERENPPLRMALKHKLEEEDNEEGVKRIKTEELE
jgi:hypothetical protein